MSRTLLRIVLLACGIVAVASALSTTAAAQVTNGALYGRVVAEDGSSLPGVTVTLSGPVGPRVQVTDANGNFRFLGLPSGDYQVKAQLEGFADLDRSNITIRAGRNTTIEARLSVSTADEEVLVASSPVLDTRSSGGSTTVSRDEIERLPIARDIWEVARLVPGVMTDRVNVGGSESGQQPSFVVGGTPRQFNSYYVDGVEITDVGGLGRAPSYYDFGSFEEFQVSTGGSDASMGSGGVAINIITKRGTNQFSGLGGYYFTDPNLSSSLDANDEQRGGQVLDHDREFSASLGGPLVRDRVWFFVAGGDRDIARDAFAAGSRVPSDFSYNSFSGKVSARVNPDNLLNGFALFQDYSRLGEGASYDRAPETTWNKSGSPTIFKFDDSHIFSSNFYLTGMAAYVDRGFALDPRGGANTPRLDAGIWRGSYYGLNADGASRQWGLDGSYFFNTGSAGHELKFGAGYRTYSDTNTWVWRENPVSLVDNFFQEPIVAFPRAGTTAIDTNYLSTYLQDTLTSGNLTVNLGFRFDRSGATDGSSLAGNADNNATAFGWGDAVSPRIGATYDLFGNGKSKIYASWGRFLSKVPNDLAARALAADSGISRTDYYDAGLTQPIPEGAFVGGLVTHLVELGGGTFEQEQPTYKQEFLGGIEFEVARSVSLGVRYVHRSIPQVLEFQDLVGSAADFGRLATPQDFIPGPIVAGTDPEGNRFDVGTYRLQPGLQYTGITLVLGGDRQQDYQGIGLTFNKRLANRWMLRGGFDYHDWSWQVPDQFFQDRNDLLGSQDNDGAPVAEPSASANKAGIFLNSRWTANVAGLYQIAPDRPWGFNVAANLTAREGYPAPYFVSVPGGDGRTRQIQIGNFDDRRLDDIFLVDARVAKDFDFGLTLAADAFNVFDDRTVLQRDGNLFSSRRGQADEFVSPRTFRFSVGFRF